MPDDLHDRALTAYRMLDAYIARGEYEEDVAALLRSDVADSEANARAQELLTGAYGSVFRAFDDLDCGFDHNDALMFLLGSLHFQSLPEDQQGKVAGLAMGFAMVAVESERGKVGTR